MSGRKSKSGKPDNVWNEHYAPHLSGGKYNAAIVGGDDTYRFYLNQITELSVNLFEWEGLPKTVNPRWLEMTLFVHGLAVFYDNEKLGKIVVKATQVGQPNYEGDPTAFQVIAPGVDNLNETVPATKAVPIWSNYMRTPQAMNAMYFANKLAAIDLSIDRVVSGMRYTKVVVADENQRLSYVNLLEEQEKGAPVVFGAPGLDLANVNVLDVGIPPDSLAALQIGKAKIWNECMLMMGVNNANQDKRERLVASEVDANDEQIESMRNVSLNARQHAAEKINTMFDLDVSVDFKVAKDKVRYAEEIDVHEDEEREGGENGGTDN